MSDFDKALSEALRATPKAAPKSAADYAAEREIESLWTEHRETLRPMRMRGHDLYDPNDTPSQVLNKMKFLLAREGKARRR